MRGRGSCARKSGRNRPLSISSNLCKIFPPGGLLGALRTAESGSNRPNRLGVIRARQRTADSGQGQKSGDEDQRAEKFRSGSFSRRPSIFDLQRPSLALSRSFTAFGLALPPDAFIT